MLGELNFGGIMKFKKTPLEELPEDWQVVRLGDIFNIKAGGDISKLNYSSKKTEKYKYPIYSNSLKNQGLYGYSDTYQYNEGCITVTGRGTLGYAVPRFEKFCAIIRLLVLIPKINVDIIFISYYINAKVNFMLEKTSIPQLTVPKLSKYRVPLPPLPEQKAIATVLSTVDKAIEKSDEAIRRIEKLKKAAMEKLLTRGIINGFMFDTNIFNKILNDEIDLSKLPRKFNYYVTYIQQDELNATKDRQRKKGLLKIFKKLKKEDLPTESLVLDVSRLDYAKLSDGKLYNKLLLKLKELDKKNGKKKTWKNQVGDVLVAETCIKNDLILVSEDKILRKVVQIFGGKAISLKQFLEGEYRKFKSTEIGKLPEDWKVDKLEHIVKFEKGAEPGRASYTNDGVPFIRVKDLTSMTNSSIYTKENNAFPKCNPNDILIALDGSPGVVVKGFYGYFSSGIRKVKLLDDMKEKVDYDYLFYILQSKLIQNTIKRYSFGVTIKHAQRAIPHLVIPLPPLPEQKKIAEILSTINKRLELEKERKEKFERVKKWLMNELLTGRKKLDIDKIMKIARGKLES